MTFLNASYSFKRFLDGLKYRENIRLLAENIRSSAENIRSRAEIIRSHFFEKISTKSLRSLGRKINGP